MGTPVTSVMTRDVVTVTPDDSWLTAVRSISEHHVHALPVVDADRRVVGVVAESDLTLKEERLDRASAPVFQRRRDRLRAGGRTVADVMSRHPVTAEPDTTLGEAARLMHRRHVGRLPVVDADRRVVGIVTRSDLLSVFLRGDDDLEAAVREALSVLPTPGGDLGITVADGVVGLTGNVPYRSHADAAARLAQQIPGVVDVTARVHWQADDLYVASGAL